MLRFLRLILLLLLLLLSVVVVVVEGNICIFNELY